MEFDSERKKSIPEKVSGFVRQSERVLNVTHKPSNHEFRQIAYVTAIGMLAIGLIGFVISMASFFIRGSGA